MHQIAPKLWIGSQADFEELDSFGTEWSVVFAARDPWHRNLLGYKTRGAPKDDLEYLFARRGKRLYMNLVDAADPAYISRELVDEAMRFIEEQLLMIDARDPDHNPNSLIVCCNKGESRAPTLGLLYMIGRPGPKFAKFDDAEADFRTIYPAYNPGEGMREFARANWDYYCRRSWVRSPENDPTSDALDIASEIWQRFCETLKSDPERARDQLLQSIVQALTAGGSDNQGTLAHGRQDPNLDA